MDIIDTASKAGNFKTLVKAVKAAGLTDTLRGEGPYTVFAPTDEAFGRLPAGTLDTLLKEPDRLRSILTFHVCEGRHAASELKRMPSAPTVNGQKLNISALGGVQVEGATVIKPDVEADNGIIHAIDRVLMPQEKKRVGRPA